MAGRASNQAGTLGAGKVPPRQSRPLRGKERRDRVPHCPQEGLPGIGCTERTAESVSKKGDTRR